MSNFILILALTCMVAAIDIIGAMAMSRIPSAEVAVIVDGAIGFAAAYFAALVYRIAK